MEEAAAPACVLDDQGRVLVANRALELLLGVGASGGLCGRTLPSLAYPPDEELAKAAVQQVLVEGLDRCQVEARWVRVFSRELVWGVFDLSLVRDRRGRPELAIAMVRDLTAMKRSEHERRFFEFMFKLIGEADSSHEVLTAAVQTICHFTRCGMGQVWLPAGNVLVCSPSWYCSGYGFEKLHVASEQIDYQLGEGLPGLAWAKRQPLLLEDIRQSGRFDRAVAAQRAGVREAMAVPVTGADGVVAVLELFVTHERAGDPGRLERIARVAEELGPLVERRRAEEALAASQRRFQAVTEAAVDAIVSADSSGRLLTWNSGAERLFGYPLPEVLGRNVSMLMPSPYHEEHDGYLANYLATGERSIIGIGRAVVAFLVWVYISAVILLYGVEFTAAYARLRRGRPEEMPAAQREIARFSTRAESVA